MSTAHLPVLTSELTALETLVGPLKAGDAALETLYRTALFATPDLRLVPVSLAVQERAARLRATPPGLRTPDAIHASTAIKSACALFLTNDPAFRRVPNLTVTFLSDLLTP